MATSKSLLSKLADWKVVACVAIVVGGAVWWFRPGAKATHGITFSARRGPLQITVVENGSIEAQESQEVRSEVKGWQGTKLLSIVEEGYQVSEEDVRTNKVLVELDSSELRKNLTTSDIDFEGKKAALTDAQKAFEIQLAQNKSDVKSAEQKARFARLDAEKYLGDQAATDICKKLKLDEKYERLIASLAIDVEEEKPPADETNQVAKADSTASNPGGGQGQAPNAKIAPGDPVPGSPAGGSPVLAMASVSSGGQMGASPDPTPSSTNAPASPPKIEIVEEPASRTVIDFSQYAKVELLGDGEAQQKLREATDAHLLAEKERSSTKTKTEGTVRLFDKGFVTRTEVETARLEYEQVDLKVKKAATALTIFIKYEFPKAAEELVSKYEEALRMFERTRQEAVSKLAQARAKLKSAEQQYRIVQENRKDLMDQIAKCTIRAKKPGLVIYGGTGDGIYWYGEERIREGAVVRERQPIITIPDMSKMSVKVKIHESHIKKVKKGMKAHVRVDAQADKPLVGEVVKVGVLPDSQNRWMNPDLKLYNVTVNVEGTHDWLKPGMSAKVEIMVNELKDVVYVPIQAVSPSGKEQVCYLPKPGGSPERRVVEVGEYNDEFIEVKNGLREKEVVLLRSPEGGGQAGEKKETGADAKDSKKAEPVRAPAPAPARAPAGGAPS